MKKFLYIIPMLLAAVPAYAASNLWEFFDGELPPIRDRAVVYQEIAADEYKGTSAQNTALLRHLEANYAVYPEFEPDEGPRLGASLTIPTPVALFETILQSSITSSQTTMTLVASTTKDGVTLASSTYGFIIDEGTSVEEFVLADCTGTSCANMVRGVSVLTGTSSVSSLQFSHRKGASVKITTAPVIPIITRIVNGIGDFPNLVRYANTVLITGSSPTTTIATKFYVDSQVSAGCSGATDSTQGCVELATATEASNGATNGSTGTRLGLPASIASSSSYVAQSQVVVSRSTDGKISPTYIATTSTDNYYFNASTTFTDINETNATTSRATTSYLAVLNVATTSRLTTGTLGVGAATTTQGSAEITGNTQIGGNVTITGNLSLVGNASTSGTCIGCASGHYMGTSSAFSLSTGTGGITGPTGATMAIIDVINTSGNNIVFRTNITIRSEGKTTQLVRYQAVDSDDYSSQFQWSGSAITVSEQSDTSTNGATSGTIWWYK